MKKICLYILSFILISCSNTIEKTELIELDIQKNEARDWRQFIDYRQGNLPLLIISVHGGDIEPEWIQTRTCDQATLVRDIFTRDVALEIEVQLKIRGYSPYVILNNLHRKKLDLNRSLNDSNCGDNVTEPYWNLFHNKIDDFRTQIENQFGTGLVIDIHGQSHEEQRIEFGYLLSSSNLRMNNSIINSLDFINNSSVKGLLNNNSDNLKLTDLLSGESSLGTFLTQKGYASVPSNEDVAPKQGDLYFSGGYNTANYGSRDGGEVDAIQIELNMIGVRDTNENRTLFSQELAEVLLEYLRTHYNSDL